MIQKINKNEGEREAVVRNLPNFDHRKFKLDSSRRLEPHISRSYVRHTKGVFQAYRHLITLMAVSLDKNGLAKF